MERRVRSIDPNLRVEVRPPTARFRRGGCERLREPVGCTRKCESNEGACARECESWVGTAGGGLRHYVPLSCAIYPRARPNAYPSALSFFFIFVFYLLSFVWCSFLPICRFSRVNVSATCTWLRGRPIYGIQAFSLYFFLLLLSFVCILCSFLPLFRISRMNVSATRIWFGVFMGCRPFIFDFFFFSLLRIIIMPHLTRECQCDAYLIGYLH